MSDTTAFGLAQRTHSMPLLAHLEELRKRIISSVVCGARRISLVLVVC
jgi:Sec-independent protein secretion pathway component TatC